MPHTLIHLVEEQHPVRRRLLDHARVQVIALCELLLVLCVLVRN